jgi:hypothetical protein
MDSPEGIGLSLKTHKTEKAAFDLKKTHKKYAFEK